MTIASSVTSANVIYFKVFSSVAHAREVHLAVLLYALDVTQKAAVADARRWNLCNAERSRY